MTIQQQIQQHVSNLDILANKVGFDFVWSEALLEIRRKFQQHGMSNEQATQEMRRKLREVLVAH